MPVEIPCGQCIGCRLERSRQWAIRCVHEASLYDDNCFLTLTYDDEHLPSDNSLNLKHFQDFLKRLRKRFGSGIRYFHCGEYGDLNNRPHYHAIIFNFDFADKVIFKDSGEYKVYVSDSLSKLWPYGYSTIGDVTFESAAYVARYCLKKVTGKDAAEHYDGRKPEYTTMSRRPGIGRLWYDRFKDDVYPSDFVVMRGKKMRPPKFYDGIFALYNYVDLCRLKTIRESCAADHADDTTYKRLEVRETVQNAKLKLLKREV